MILQISRSNRMYSSLTYWRVIRVTEFNRNLNCFVLRVVCCQQTDATKVMPWTNTTGRIEQPYCWWYCIASQCLCQRHVTLIDHKRKYFASRYEMQINIFNKANLFDSYVTGKRNHSEYYWKENIVNISVRATVFLTFQLEFLVDNISSYDPKITTPYLIVYRINNRNKISKIITISQNNPQDNKCNILQNA